MFDIEIFLEEICNAFNNETLEELEMVDFLKEFSEEYDNSVRTVPFELDIFDIEPIRLKPYEGVFKRVK